MTNEIKTYRRPVGRVAVIGAGDLGSHVARAALAYGATAVLLTGNRRMEAVHALAKELATRVPSIALQLADLKDKKLVEETLDRAEHELGGPIEKFVVTVALQPATPQNEQTPEEYQRVFDVNVIGPYFFTKYVLDRATLPAHVVLVSSDNSLPEEYDPNTPHYDGSKAALNHMVRHLAFHYARGGHQVNAVLPGWIDVASQKDVEGLAAIHRAIALGRPATAEEAAIGVLHMLVEPHVSGTLRVVANGGGTNRAHLRQH